MSSGSSLGNHARIQRCRLAPELPLARPPNAHADLRGALPSKRRSGMPQPHAEAVGAGSDRGSGSPFSGESSMTGSSRAGVEEQAEVGVSRWVAR